MKFIFHYDINSEIKHVKEILPMADWFKEDGYKIKLPKKINKRSGDAEIRKAIEKDFLSAKDIYAKL